MKDATIALALAGLTFLITVIWGGPLIIILRRFRIGKQIRIDEPQHHQTKMGTPTMGGFMFLIPVTLLTILFNEDSIVIERFYLSTGLKTSVKINLYFKLICTYNV